MPENPTPREEFANSSVANKNSPRNRQIKVRKNEMKVRKNEIKVPKNFSIPPWRISNSSGGNADKPRNSPKVAKIIRHLSAGLKRKYLHVGIATHAFQTIPLQSYFD